MKSLYIVDYSNWAYKFKHTFSELGVTAHDGRRINTSVLYGFTQALRSHLYSDIIIALDGCPERSLSILPQYKQTREHKTTDQLYVPRVEIFAYLSQVGAAFNKNVRLAAICGCEADQVIATVVEIALGKVSSQQMRMASFMHRPLSEDKYLAGSIEQCKMLDLDMNYEAVIVGSTDSDCYQLKEIKGCYIDTSWSGSKVDFSDETPKAVYNMPVDRISVYKAFCGDVSDNVPAIVPSKQRVRNLIKEHIDETYFKKFIEAVRFDKPVKPELQHLYEVVKEVDPGAHKLERNYRVVKLQYEGTVDKLLYPTYSYLEIARKYKLRGF